MKRDGWLRLIAGITPDRPLDLDAGPDTASAGEGGGRGTVRGGLPDGLGGDLPVPSARLWTRATGEDAFIGIRVTRALPDVSDIAARLAAVAIERNVQPVILSSLDRSGFESLGFRVERLPAAPESERQRFEAELTAFWQLSVIIDADDISALR